MAVATSTTTNAGANHVGQLALLMKLSGEAVGTDCDALRDDLLDQLAAIEALPLDAKHNHIRARALAVMYGDFADWEDDSPAGRIVLQLVRSHLG